VTNGQFRAWAKGEHDYIYLRVIIPNGFDSIDEVTYLETALLYHPELSKCDWTIKRIYRLLVKDAKGNMVEKGKRALIIQSLPPALDYIKRSGVYLPPRPDGPAHPAWLLDGLYSQFRVSVANATDLVAKTHPKPATVPVEPVEPVEPSERVQGPPTPIPTKLKVEEFVARPLQPRQLFKIPNQNPIRTNSGLDTINESMERTGIRDEPPSTNATGPVDTNQSRWADDIDSEPEHGANDMDTDLNLNDDLGTDDVDFSPEETDRLLK